MASFSDCAQAVFGVHEILAFLQAVNAYVGHFEPT
jgi:hypothetical protein